MSDTVQITVPEYVKKVFEGYAKKHDIKFGEAAERVTGVAVSRLNALKKYADSQKEGKPAPRKKAAKKAKGPIARKSA